MSRPLVPSELSKLSSSSGSGLNDIIDSLSDTEKYTFLIQSLATKILENSNSPSEESMKKISTLYSEMISKSVKPDGKTAQYLLDASATFCDCDLLGNSLRSIKQSGILTGYGLGTGFLTSPPCGSVAASVFDKSIVVPSDDREKEVLYAGLAGGTAVLYLTLQLCSFLVSEAHPWATLGIQSSN